MRTVYLDNAATTQVRDEVIAKMQDALATSYGNPSSTHSYGRTAKTAVESARKTIAKYLNAQASEIIFTSGGTEADNMILRHTVEELAHKGLVNLTFVTLDDAGNPDMHHLEALLKKDDSKKLVSLMHVNNEIGNTIDIEAITKLAKTHNALVHSDTVQSIGHYNWDVKEIDIDFMAAAAHKFHGPKGIGFAFIRKNMGLGHFISGGSQERGYRAGTESLHNIVGLEEAFVRAYDGLEEEKKYVLELKKYFIAAIRREIPAVKFNGHSGDLEKSTYTLVNVCLPVSKEKALMLLFHLDIKGIACSKGSACQSGSDKGSHVLSEILSEDDLEKPSLRFSFSKYNTKEEIDYTVGVLKEFTLQ